MPIPQVDYTSRDYEAIISDLVAKIPFFTSEWTDTNPSDFGIVLLELFSMVADSLHFQVDRALNESYLPTATARRSVVNLLKLIDYELSSASPATVDIKFTLGETQLVDVVIPAGTQVLTEGEPQLTFETNEALTITAGTLEGTVGATEGETQEEDVGVSDGRAFQRFELTLNPIIDGTLRLYVDEGGGEELWTETDSLALADSDAKVYNTQRDDENVVTVFFGDDGQGKIPADGATIRAVARVGGGEQGNVGAGSITILASPIYVGINPIAVAVTNDLSSTGGQDEEDIENAKLEGPRSLRALSRAVTEEDFETFALQVDGVAKANAVVENELFRIINIYVSPEPSGGPTSSVLKLAVKSFLDERKMAGTIVEILDSTEVPIEMAGTIHVFDTFVQEDVQIRVEAALDQLLAFDNEENVFARQLNLSDTITIIDGIEGVDFVDMTKHTITPVVTLITWSGDATFGIVSVGPAVLKETWNVQFNSPTTFVVEGSLSGVQVNTGTVDVLYTSDSGEISFTITSGSSPMVVDDHATIRTDAYLTNIFLLDNELSVLGARTLTYVGGA